MKDDVANTTVKDAEDNIKGGSKKNTSKETVKNSYQEEEKDIANESIEIEAQVEA